VRVTNINGSDADKSKITETLDSMDIDSNDVIWYYYTGHGMNYDTWPESDEGEVPLTWVHHQLKETDARLTIASYDCVNYWIRILHKSTYCRCRYSSLKPLFLLSKGNIIVSSNSSASYSYGSEDGSVFTNHFLDALAENSSWSDVLESATQQTKQVTKEYGKVQEPKYEMSNMEEGADVDFRVAPGHFRLLGKAYSSLDEVATAIEEMLKDAEPDLEVTITKEDLLRWNPTMTKENWKTFKKVYWDLEK
jgi:hypothetical protein